MFPCVIKVEVPIARLAKLALKANVITEVDYKEIIKTPLQIRASHLPIEAAHFVNYVSQTNQALEKTSGRLHTILVVDNKTREIYALALILGQPLL